VWAPQAAARTIREAATKAHGSATLFRRQAEGGMQAPALQPLTPPLDQLHRHIKAAFDPAGIFNPGRLYSDL
jgi:glycolate oxidase FAD binding subunit